MTGGLAYPYGKALLEGVLKARPEDFVVDEELGFEPDGDGEHYLLRIEKIGLSTMELVEQIARAGALAPRGIGYAGLKDKQAVTRQWLSLHLPGREMPAAVMRGENYRVLTWARHRRKLRHGSHRVNRFKIRLGEVDSPPGETLEQIRLVTKHGFANYFGEQRFGRGQDNVAQALRQLGRKRMSHSRRGLLISALRSFLFNQVLARRIEQGHWYEPLDGDVFMLRGSHSIFTAAIDRGIIARYQDLDISSCASLYGSGSGRLRGLAQQLESEVLAAHNEITACLERQGARLQMRNLREVAEDFSYDYDATGRSLIIEFALPAGSYATSLMAHFIDAGRSA